MPAPAVRRAHSWLALTGATQSTDWEDSTRIRQPASTRAAHSSHEPVPTSRGGGTDADTGGRRASGFSWLLYRGWVGGFPPIVMKKMVRCWWRKEANAKRSRRRTGGRGIAKAGGGSLRLAGRLNDTWCSACRKIRGRPLRPWPPPPPSLDRSSFPLLCHHQCVIVISLDNPARIPIHHRPRNHRDHWRPVPAPIVAPGMSVSATTAATRRFRGYQALHGSNRAVVYGFHLQ